MTGEAFINSSAKAMSEPSESLFVPAMTIGLVVEFPFYLVGKEGFDLLGAYLVYAVVGLILSFVSIFFVGSLGGENQTQYFIAGSGLLPVGVAAIFPEFFSDINIPIEQATGACICVWGFFLMKHFFDHSEKFNEDQEK
ncbi:hypothetical protein [Marinimicrobium locisalis]|uniref:hypothetical protein n=1 Tax=Marinimicrobium locisalis TaxID=546022 RepID=UPI0032220631